MTPTITSLHFDSSLFNYPVGKTILGEEWREEEFLDAAKDFQLVYLFSATALEISSPRIQLVDTKITFQKTLESTQSIAEIQSYAASKLEEELMELAYLSGTYSRFKTDLRLQQGEFQELYSIWITKAFENKGILLAPNKAGMVTYTVEQEMGKIGLIAVSERYQGQGWGKKLVKEAEFQAEQSGAKSMQIPTQETNLPACKLYQSLGYHPVGKDYIYHWWKS